MNIKGSPIHQIAAFKGSNKDFGVWLDNMVSVTKSKDKEKDSFIHEDRRITLFNNYNSMGFYVVT